MLEKMILRFSEDDVDPHPGSFSIIFSRFQQDRSFVHIVVCWILHAVT